MSHKELIKDMDSVFEIDPITRQIRDTSASKVSVVQYDHNSERFRFSLLRFIEGHDMATCNRAEVHYLTKSGASGVYEITDLAISEEDEDKVVCSWLLSQNATKDTGTLAFLVRFSCVAEDGTIEYAWNSGIYNGIAVTPGIYNASAIVEQYADVLEQWKQFLLGTGGSFEGAGGFVSVDAVMSNTSTNPVQNKVVMQYIVERDTELQGAVSHFAKVANEAMTISENAEQIAKGRATGYAFNTEDDMRNALNDAEFKANLVHGDNLYIRALNVPDYWWDASTQNVYPLETQKVDMSDYATKASFVYDETTETLIITL